MRNTLRELPLASESAAPDLGALVAKVAGQIESRLGRPFRPAQTFLVTALPKTRNAKITRRLIRRICADEPLGDLSALDNPDAIAAIRAILKSGRVAPR
jgi:acetyl-CoA synthetase